MSETTGTAPAAVEPLGIGRVLGDSLRLLRRQFRWLVLPVFAVALIANLTTELIQFAASDTYDPFAFEEELGAPGDWMSLVSFLVQLAIAVSLVSRVAFQSLAGGMQPGMHCIHAALRAVPRVIVITGAVCLALGVIAVAASVVVILAGGSVAGTLFASLFGAVGFLWGACYFYLAPTAAAVEPAGGRSPIPRGAQLTAGNRWRVLALILIATAMSFAMISVAIGLGFLLLFEAGGSSLATLVPLVVVSAFADSTFMLTSALIPAVAYVELRRIHEGVAAGEVLHVFD